MSFKNIMQSSEAKMTEYLLFAYTSNTLLPRFQLNKKELDIFMQILFVLEIKTKYDKNLKFILSIIVISKLPRRLLAALGSRERKSLFHLKQFLLNAPRKTKIYRKTITLGGRTVRNWKKISFLEWKKNRFEGSVIRKGI